MGIRIGDYLEKNHKFSRSKILHAMKLSGMLHEDKSYRIKRENIYNIKLNNTNSQRKLGVSIKNNGNSKAA